MSYASGSSDSSSGSSDSSSDSSSLRAKRGCFVHGLFLEGARWDNCSKTLDESIPFQLFCLLPTIQLVPSHIRDISPTHSYNTPVYKERSRQGVLSTTGHSTNFVMWIRLPMRSQHSEKHWTLRGAACLCQSD